MPGQGLSKKKEVDYQQKCPTRFFGEVKPPESSPVSSSEPMAPVPVPTTSGRKIALEVLSTLTPLEDSASLHLIPLGSLQGAVGAFTCCGSPLAVVEDRNQRRGLVSKLFICCSVCSSVLPSQIYIRREIWRLTPSLC